MTSEEPASSGIEESEIYQAPELDAFELDQFAKLIAQESHTIDGQRAMMELIHEMVNERRQRREGHIRQRLTASGTSVDELAPLLRKEMSRMVIYTDNKVPDGRHNVIVELGGSLLSHEQPGRDEIRALETTVAVIAHADTVIPTTDDQLELREDPNKPDLLTGRGVWDMKQAVLNNLWYIEHIDPPPGMRVYIIFTFDEEETSLGAKTLVKSWRRWPSVDVVYSHEIGPNTAEQDPEGDNNRHTLHPGRRGRAKYEFNASLPTERLDHGASEIGQVGKAVADMVHMLMKQYPMKRKSGDILQKRTKILGAETLELPNGSWLQTQPGYGVSDKGSAQFNIALVPPSNRLELEQLLRDQVAALAKKEGWDSLGIDWDLFIRKDVTSYDGYELEGGKDHPLTSIVASTIERVSGIAPGIMGATSVADECIYAGNILDDKEKIAEKPYAGVISHPPRGGNAHGDAEWVSKESIRSTRSVGLHLLEHPDGFQQWISEEARNIHNEEPQ
jgi:acetylornithine deacetylase/succinyl-diaminopimelate desuccinylase-like protein